LIAGKGETPECSLPVSTKQPCVERWRRFRLLRSNGTGEEVLAMSRSKRLNRESQVAEVPRHMADAVLYLSQVAEDAGLEDISADLKSISRKLSRNIRRTPKCEQACGDGNQRKGNKQ
jgi:hypothetical protein